MDAFIQSPPQLKNAFLSDRLLRTYLKRAFKENVQGLNFIVNDLAEFGERAVTELLTLAHEAEREAPVHVPFDPWGGRIDEVRTSEAWKKLHQIAAEEGLVAIGYERKFGELSRLYQFAKLYLFQPSSAFYSCPLAMTDGAARLLEVQGKGEFNKALEHLTSRDARSFWTSGQWMTERAGGSDVRKTQTIAKPNGADFCLYGDKWFCSGITGEMAMTLGHIEGKNGELHGLSLFYLELRSETGALNGIKINRLKDKLGTRALPTAEITLDGTRARPIGAPGEGIKRISTLFNMTRIYNSNAAASFMRRVTDLAVDYAARRESFGRKLIEHPLHLETLAELEIECDVAFHLSFLLALLQGKEECATISAVEQGVLRLFTPIVKLYTGKQAVKVAAEAIECIGGAAYVEDTGLAKWSRDMQVFSIWEGTTNVLSLDALRAIQKENVLPSALAFLKEKLSQVENEKLLESKKRVENLMQSFLEMSEELFLQGPDLIQADGRNLSFFLAEVLAAVLLLDHAQWACLDKTVSGRDQGRFLITANRWCDRLEFKMGKIDRGRLDHSRSVVSP